jgi:hypothetical protein
VSDQLPNETPGEACRCQNKLATPLCAQARSRGLTPRTPETLPLDSDQPVRQDRQRQTDYGDESSPTVSAVPVDRWRWRHDRSPRFGHG